MIKSRIQKPNAKKSKKNVFAVNGVITEILPKAQFRIKLENDMEIIGYVSGKIRVYSIRLFRGDRVSVEISPYDLTKGRIVYCYKKSDRK